MKKNHSSLLVFGTIIILLIVIALLAFYQDQSIAGNTITSEKPIYKIGSPLELTGKYASFGEDLKNAMNLAAEEVNQKKPFKLEIIYEDTQSDTKNSVTAAKKLIEVDNIKILIGMMSSGNVMAIAPVSEENKVILFTPGASSGEITTAGDFVFRNRETSEAHGKGMAEFLKNQGITKVAVFAAQSSNSQSYKEAFIKKFKNLGGTIIFISDYNSENKDFKTDIAKAQQAGAEAFYLGANSGIDPGLICKQAKELGFNGIIVGSAGLESEEFLTSAGQAAEGVYFTSPAFDLNNPKVKEYNEKYLSLYNEESSAFAANAYDAVKIIADAIESCQDYSNTACIRDYLYNIRDYPGIGGTTTFDSNGDVIKPVMIKVVKEGEFVRYEQ
jgi:branched-chain amino acid transport system substrate-binding protein